MDSMEHQKPKLKTWTNPDPVAIEIQPSSPRYSLTRSKSGCVNQLTPAGDHGTHRKIAIPVDLSDESAFAVRWAVQNYLRQGDAVTLIHVRPTSVLYGADWGSTHFSGAGEDDSGEQLNKEKVEEDFDSFTEGKIAELAEPLVKARVPIRVHIVKDHDMKERLCLEIERLGMSVVIMGSRGFGASRRSCKGRLGSVSDYCVQHCVCPVVVVRYQEEERESSEGGSNLHPVLEEEEPEVVDLPHQEDHMHQD